MMVFALAGCGDTPPPFSAPPIVATPTDSGMASDSYTPTPPDTGDTHTEPADTGPFPALWGDVDEASAGARLLGAFAEAPLAHRTRAIQDVNGDGLNDILISETDYFDAGHRVYVVSGLTGGDLEVGPFPHLLIPYEPGQEVEGVSNVGDHDGDGLDEFLVDLYIPLLAEDAFEGERGYIFSTAIANVAHLSSALAQIDFPEPKGIDVVFWGVGDMTGDQNPDIAVGMTSDPVNKDGVVWLFEGPVSGTLTSSDAKLALVGAPFESNLGWGAAGLGDHDGDGLDDLLVSSTTEVFLLHGPLTADLVLPGDHDARVFDLYPYPWAYPVELGYPDQESLYPAGDVDGDGHPDVLLGQNWVMSGPLVGELDLDTSYEAVILAKEPDYIDAGHLEPAGDVNGDGYADVLHHTYEVNIFERDPRTIHLLYGPLSGTVELGTTGANLTTTTDVSDYEGVGDLNGDGFDDILITSSLADGVVPSAGAAYVFFGAP